MKMLTFSNRTAKDILRDPLTVLFGLGFPLVLLLLLSAIQSNVPVELFRIQHLAPGIAVFGLSFITLFSATLLARDRETSLLQRLYTTPLTPADYILGYALPLLPIGLAQTVICYAAAIPLGLEPSLRLLPAILITLPISLLYIALGLLFGSVLNVKQAGGICGALFTNLSAWLSGTWFDLALVGGWFERLARMLPFVHAVELQQAILTGSGDPLPHLLWVLGYAAASAVAAVLLFLRQMRRQ